MPFKLTIYKHKLAKAIKIKIPNNAFSLDLMLLRNRGGPMIVKKAIQNVRVYTMDTAVLMARIWPNLENSWIVVRQRGIEAAMVVTAELRMEEPTCETAAAVLQPRRSYTIK
jgi:hypothetical protein